jgi:protein-tyrosine phosphatase
MASLFARFDDLGGNRSAAQYFLYRASAMLGGFGRYTTIRPDRVERLVFVCSGNICRSPYADRKVRALGKAAVSCGTSAIDGAPANACAIRIAQERGVDLSMHVSMTMMSLQFRPGDLVIALEPQHLRAVAPLAGQAGAQTTLLGLWCTSRAPYIPDPYARADACFREVFRLIDEALANLLKHLT